MPSFLRSIAAFAVASSLASAVPALAAQAGWSQITVPGLANAQEPIAVALYYPTQAAERSIAMGPFLAQVAPQARPDPTVKGLIVVSHGWADPNSRMKALRRRLRGTVISSPRCAIRATTGKTTASSSAARLRISTSVRDTFLECSTLC